MVYRCVIPNCGVIYSNTSKMKLYRFPTDEVLKTKWMKSCSITKHLVSYKVCSNHFLPEDIKDNGRLMPSAVPSIQLGVNLHPDSENSSKTDISTKNNFKLNQADSPQKSDTSTSLITNISPTQTPKKQKISLNYPRYFNDLTDEHFATPKRAKIHLEFAKKKHNDTRNKLKNVEQQNQRLAKKVKTYQDLIKTLEDTNLLTEIASQSMQMPDTRCVVALCSNSLQVTKKKDLNIVYHTFPKDKKLCNLWINACRQKDTWEPKTSTVCSIHFLEDDFEVDPQSQLMNIKTKIKLKPQAIPTQCLKKSSSDISPQVTSRQQHENENIVKNVILPTQIIEDESLQEVHPDDRYKNLLNDHEKLSTKYKHLAELKRNQKKRIIMLNKKLKLLSQKIAKQTSPTQRGSKKKNNF